MHLNRCPAFRAKMLTGSILVPTPLASKSFTQDGRPLVLCGSGEQAMDKDMPAKVVQPA